MMDSHKVAYRQGFVDGLVFMGFDSRKNYSGRVRRVLFQLASRVRRTFGSGEGLLLEVGRTRKDLA